MRPTGTEAVTAAWVLAAGAFAAMLVAQGPARAVLLLVLAALQLGLQLVAARRLRAAWGRRLPALWSLQASLTWLVAGDPTTVSVLVYVVVGLVFAALAEVVLRVVGRYAASEDAREDTGEDTGPAAARRADTAPLPAVDAEEP